MNRRIALLNLGTHHGTQWAIQEEDAPSEIILPVGVGGLKKYLTEDLDVISLPMQVEVYRLIGHSPKNTGNVFYYEYDGTKSTI